MALLFVLMMVVIAGGGRCLGGHDGEEVAQLMDITGSHEGLHLFSHGPGTSVGNLPFPNMMHVLGKAVLFRGISVKDRLTYLPAHHSSLSDNPLLPCLS